MTPDQYRRSQDLFLRAVEIDADKRVAWLHDQCGGDTQLQQNVQKLLDKDDPRTLLVRNVDVERKSSTVRRRLLPYWLEAMPPRGLLAIGAITVLLPVLLLGAIADRSLRLSRNQWRATSLIELVTAKENAITAWLSREQFIVQSWADSASVRELVSELVDISEKSTAKDRSLALREAPQQEALNQELVTLVSPSVRYAVWDTKLITIADWSAERRGLGTGVTPAFAERLTAVLQGKPSVVILGPNDVITRDYPGVPQPRLGMFVPVMETSSSDAAAKPIAVLLVYETGGEEELGRFIGSTISTTPDDTDGGTFVFNRYGMLLYDSPYDPQLRQLGLLPSDSVSYSAKNLELRDPGVDLTRGQIPTEEFASRPLTKMVRMAVGGGAGFDVEGYRDVRGVRVAGAWRWLKDYEFGIGIEVEQDAMEPAMWLARLQSWTIFALLGTSVSVIGYSMFAIRKLNSQLDKIRRIGPYKLEAMIGEGGMGQVFLARHDLLKRPTAIKLLRPELMNSTTITRFQREAELAARLEHPNTINIFDFGVTKDGLLYLVMELIDGVTLAELIAREGKLDPMRAVHLLRQVALSLREAHQLGLIHRDLKPSNVMVCNRAGEIDVVKVLDFGLARDITCTATTQTATGLIAGTPQYMAPERWQPLQPITPAVDMFAFGCIAYFMLTACHAIEGTSVEEICIAALSQSPRRPTNVIGDSIPRWLDELTVQCMATDPQQRPSSFDMVLKELSAVHEN